MERLDLHRLRPLLKRLIDEDVGRGDITTSSVVGLGRVGRGRLEFREPAIVAGLDVARACFDIVAGGPMTWDAQAGDGAWCEIGPVAYVEGSLAAILTAERVALNLLGRMSAVATQTARFVSAVEDTPARILDTRKTTPGLRALEKYAVRTGGGFNHRFGLDDGVLIKDNHVAVSGGVTKAVSRAKGKVPHSLKIQVEVSSLAELDEALTAGADAVLMDNMGVDMVREAVGHAGGKVLLEASGGIDLTNVAEYARSGVDFISVGAITHRAGTIDVALEVES